MICGSSPNEGCSGSANAVPLSFSLESSPGNWCYLISPSKLKSICLLVVTRDVTVMLLIHEY